MSVSAKSAERTGLCLFGGGTRGSVIVDFVRWRLDDRFALQGFYDDDPNAGGRLGIPRLGSIADGLRELPGAGAAAVLALGTYRSWRACELLHDLRQRKVAIAQLVSPMAFVSPSAELGPGALVLDGVFIGARARVGALLTANAAAVVEHDSILGHNVMLGSGAAIAGFARIGDHCFVGTNATVLPSVAIGAGSLVGAGGTVTRDLPAGVVAIGAPAKASRSVRAGDEVPDAARIAALPPLD
jgi:sugar O-acyltransferase (sialic acid O-acetyltransferase NeuD family)